MAPPTVDRVNRYLERRFEAIRGLPEERRREAIESLRQEFGVPDAYRDLFTKAATGTAKILELSKRLVQEMPADKPLFKLALAPEGQQKSTILNAYRKMRERGITEDPGAATPLTKAPPIDLETSTAVRGTARALAKALRDHPEMKEAATSNLGFMLEQMVDNVGHSFKDGYTLVVGDVEGLSNSSLRTAIEAGLLVESAGGRTLTLRDAQASVLVLGDLVDRGPTGIRTVEGLLSIDAKRLSVVWGNHELGKLDIFHVLPELETLSNRDYVSWLVKKEAPSADAAKLSEAEKTAIAAKGNVLENRVQYFLENRAARGQLEFHRQELSILEGREVTLHEAAVDYVDSYKPGGRMYRIITAGNFSVLGGVGGNQLPPSVAAFHAGVSDVSLGRPTDGKPAAKIPDGMPGAGQVDFADWVVRSMKHGASLAEIYKQTGVPPEILRYIGESNWDGGLGANKNIDIGTVYTATPRLVHEKGGVASVDEANAGTFTESVAASMRASGITAAITGHKPQASNPVPLEAPGDQVLIRTDTSYTDLYPEVRGSKSLLVVTKDGVAVMTGRVGGEDGRFVTWTRELNTYHNNPVGKVTDEGAVVAGVTIGKTGDGPSNVGQPLYFTSRYVPGRKVETAAVGVRDLRARHPKRSFGVEGDPTLSNEWRQLLASEPENDVEAGKQKQGEPYARKYDAMLVDAADVRDKLGGRVPVGVVSGAKLGQSAGTPEQRLAAAESLVDALGAEAGYLTGATDSYAKVPDPTDPTKVVRIPSDETNVHTLVLAAQASTTEAGKPAPVLIGSLPDQTNSEWIGQRKQYLWPVGRVDNWMDPLQANMNVANAEGGVMVFFGGGPTPTEALELSLRPEYRATDFVLFASAPDPVTGKLPTPIGAADAFAQRLMAMPVAERPANFHIVTADRASELGPVVKEIIKSKRRPEVMRIEHPGPSARPARVGVYAGSFDPPHLGHKAVVERMKAEFGLDVVYVVPDHSTAYKQMQSIEHRQRMVQTLFAGDPSVRLLEPEVEAKIGAGELWDVVRTVQGQHAGAQVFNIMGTDTFEWYRRLPPEQRTPGVEFLVNDRHDGAALPDSFDGRPVRAVRDLDQGISSTKVRRQLEEGGTPAELAPEVLAYIKRHGLYR